MYANEGSEAAGSLVKVGLKMADVVMAHASDREDGWKGCWCDVIAGCFDRIAMPWLCAPDEFKELSVDAIEMMEKMAEGLQGS
eukprot:49962-Eustigmatos_ZCMA.PRE.1